MRRNDKLKRSMLSAISPAKALHLRTMPPYFDLPTNESDIDIVAIRGERCFFWRAIQWASKSRIRPSFVIEGADLAYRRWFFAWSTHSKLEPVSFL